MFEHMCALLLRLYPAEFRRAYGDEAVQLMIDRARHERGLFLRVRLLIDLAIDLGALSLRGWHFTTPWLARLHDRPRFDVIDSRGPRLLPLAVGMLMSILMFASLPLLLQPKASASGRASLDANRFERGMATNPEGHYALIAAIAANLTEHYVDRAIGQQLADALVAHARKGEYASFDVGATLAARITRDIQDTGRALGIPPASLSRTSSTARSRCRRVHRRR